MKISHVIRKRIFPELHVKLKSAKIHDDPDYFLKKTFMTSLYLTLGLCFVMFSFTKAFGLPIKFILITGPIILLMTFFYFMRAPDVIIKRKEKEINKELIFAGRFLVIELESGVPLYQAMINIAKNYEYVGKYYKEIVDKVDVGTSMETAILETLETVPSDNLRKMLWQILNSLKTGADINDSLSIAIDQVVREQKIEMQEYGKKLNPLAMFYMMAAVIVPSLGMTMLTILSTFMGFKLTLPLLLTITFTIAFIQFMFVAMIKNSRPAIEL